MPEPARVRRQLALGGHRGVLQAKQTSQAEAWGHPAWAVGRWGIEGRTWRVEVAKVCQAHSRPGTQ